MIREVSISSRTGYAYSSNKERIREALAILVAISCVGMTVCTVGSLSSVAQESEPQSMSEYAFSSESDELLRP